MVKKGSGGRGKISLLGGFMLFGVRHCLATHPRKPESRGFSPFVKGGKAGERGGVWRVQGQKKRREHFN